jgi:hypothetical protein
MTFARRSDGSPVLAFRCLERDGSMSSILVLPGDPREQNALGHAFVM